MVSESGTITTVTRGYGDGELARPGRDGSYELRQVDMEALYDEYKTSARRFAAKSKLKDYTRGAKLAEEQFEGAMRRLRAACTREELHEVADDILGKWPPNDNGCDKSQWDEMSRLAKELDGRFEETEDTQALHVKDYSLSVRYTPPDSIETQSTFARYDTVEVERYSVNVDKLAGRVKKQYGATPDEWEEETANVLASIGFDVKFKARSLSKRRADATIDGKRWEFKNPSGSGYLCVHNQVKSNLYGENKHKLNPQSSRIVISNVRSMLTLDQMEEQLRRVMDGESGFTDKELSKIEAVLLLDKQARAAEVAAKAAEHGVDADMLARMSGDVEANALFLEAREDARPKFGDMFDGGEQPSAAQTLEDIRLIALL